MGVGTRGDPARTVRAVLAALELRESGDVLRGDMPADMWGQTVFGGFVIAHAVAAATRNAPAGRRLHSLHAYFHRPVVGGKPITYRSTTLRDGRTLTSRRLEAEQDDRRTLTMMNSFAADTEGYEYQWPMPADAPGPDGLPTRELGPWVIAEVGPTAPAPDGTRASTHRMWFRTAAALPDDTHVWAALVAFATDITYKGGRPLHLEGDTRGMVSIDHAVWFHRPMRPDRWSYYDVHSLINAGGRGVLRGAMYSEDGRLCVSVAQEMLLARYEDAPTRD